ncbi:hypothetical protein BJ912DRAFT_94959 [Pholiota molesta]|nr:hypothetical protein BJ912DRAFT_94959 [Pholiota molesta]
MSTSPGIRCNSWKGCRLSDPPPISHFPNPTPEQASQIADLDANIQRMDDHIKALINQRAALSRKRNALVPAVNLPPEVLATIFEFACSRTPLDPEYNESDMATLFDKPFRSLSTSKQYYCACTTTPTLIGAVCSAWKNIEKSQLWSNTTITFDDTNSGAQAAKLRYRISKSGQRPLNLSLVEAFNDDEDGNCTVCLDLFLSEGWKHEPAIARIAKRLPLLTCVSLRPGSGLQGMEHFSLFAHAPKLREVRLIDCCTTTVSLPLAQLEHLEVASPSSVEECLNVLRLCPRLRSYTTYINDTPRDFASVLPPMTHTKLEVLDVMDNSMPEMGIRAFLEALTLPMLCSFSLYIRAKDPHAGIPSLLPFLSRSAGKLETLCLAGQMPSEKELLGCLRMLPQLRKLVLNNKSEGNPLTQRILDQMNPTKYDGADEEGARKCLAPNLETFYYSGSIELPPHSLIEFLTARWRSPSSTCNLGHDVEIQPSIELETRTQRGQPPPRNVPLGRLRSVAFVVPKYSGQPKLKFDDTDTAVLQRLQQEGMIMIF